MSKVDELITKRNRAWEQAKEILERASGESRGMTTEERASWDAANKDVDGIGETIEALRSAEVREKQLDQLLPGSRRITPLDGGEPGRDGGAEGRDMRPLEVYLEKRFGRTVDLDRVDWRGRAETPVFKPDTAAQRALFRRYLVEGENMREYRDLMADSDVAGGSLVPPQEFLARLIKFVDDMVFIRRMGTVLPATTAETLGVPSLETDPADLDWTSEVASVGADTAMAFGKREMQPHELSKLVKVSMKLLRNAAIDVEALVAQRLAYKASITQEKGFLTGSGANQPLGIFTASANGISTGRDVSTSNTTTAFTADGLLEAMFSCKAQYQASGVWLFHRTAIKKLRELKDGNSQYLWQPTSGFAGIGLGSGMVNGLADMLFGRPVYMSEYVPSTFTTGQYVGLFGDLNFYWIVDAMNPTLQRLNELYAGNSQVGFILRGATDGMPVLEEAFARVTLA